MTTQEMQSAIEQLKAEGHDEETILGAFYRMFQEEQLTLDELDGVVNLMGYHLTDEFKAMSPEDQKTKGYEETGEEEKPEDVDAGEGKELTDGGKEVVDESEKEDESDKPDKSDDSDEEARAMKLFGQK